MFQTRIHVGFNILDTNWPEGRVVREFSLLHFSGISDCHVAITADSSFNTLLHSFRRDVIEQAKTIENSLVEFQVVQNIRRKDVQLHLKKLASLNRRDAGAALRQWEGVAKALERLVNVPVHELDDDYDDYY